MFVSLYKRTSGGEENLSRKILFFQLVTDSNLFGSCSDPQLDRDPNGHENQDPDPNKVGSDPQH